jgi:short-subunit dehydrogenase
LPGFSVYSIAKAGLVALTKILAKELAPEIRINAVAPGAILWPDQGEMNEQQKQEIAAKVALQRVGTPEDIARAIAFLIADAAYVTGQASIYESTAVGFTGDAFYNLVSTFNCDQEAKHINAQASKVFMRKPWGGGACLLVGV